MTSVEQMTRLMQQQQARQEAHETPYYVALIGPVGEDADVTRHASDSEADEVAQNKFTRMKAQGVTAAQYQCIEVREIRYGITPVVLRQYEFE